MFRKAGFWEASALNFYCGKASDCYSGKKLFIDIFLKRFGTPIIAFVRYNWLKIQVVIEAAIKIVPLGKSCL